MIRSRHYAMAALVWLTTVSLAWAQAKTGVLEVLPGDALGFVIIRDPAELSGKLAALAQKLQMPLPPLLDMAKAQAGIQQGLAEDGNVAVAVVNRKDEDRPYTMVVFVPVTDYGQFIGQLQPTDAKAKITEVTFYGSQSLVGKKGNYAVFAESSDGEVLEKVLASTGGIAAATAPLADLIASNDTSVVVTPAGTKLLFATIRRGLEQAIEGAAAISGGGGDTVKASLGMYAELLGAGEKEITHISTGFRIDPQSHIELRKRLVWTKDGNLAGMLGELKPAEGTPLSGLPAGPFAVAFTGAMPAKVPDALFRMSFEMLKSMPAGEGAAQLTDEDVKKLTDASKASMQGVKSMSMVMGVGKPGGGLYSELVGVIKVEDAQTYLKAYEKALGLMNELAKEKNLPFLGMYEIKHVQAGGAAALEVIADMSKLKMPGTPELAQMEKMFEIMFGKGGKLSAYLAAADDHTVVLAYTSPQQLQRGIEAYQSGMPGLAADASLAKTAALLPAGSQWVGYLSLGGTIQIVGDFIKAFSPQAEVKLPEFPAVPPIGFSGKASATQGDFQLFVPVETIVSIATFAQQAIQQNKP